MKIAVVINRYGLIGGAENFAFELTEGLARLNGFKVHVYANKWRNRSSPITFHKIPSFRFPRCFRPINFAYYLKRMIRAEAFDVVHSHERILEMNFMTFHGIPHSTWIRETKRKRLSLFDRATAWVEREGVRNNGYPVILPVSNLVKEEILKLYDIPESRIRVIHPGVAVHRFSVLERAACRREIRDRHGFSEDDVVVLFVGMNFEIKRLDLVLKGVADLAAKGNRQVKLLVAGKGNIKRYSSVAHDFGISRRVIFAGVIREAEKYYMASDIFAMPSRYEAFGLVVMEAMAAGLPVIISGRVGARDIITSGLNGLILPDHPNFSDMAEALSLLMDPGRRKKMGENAKKKALKHNWDSVVHKMAQLYKTLI
jgi:UDP-glucose:(heptosyl)LPS alpha-1,3-glucosyltransferase